MISLRSSKRLNRKNEALRNCKALLTGLCVLLSAGGGTLFADDSSALMHPDRLKALAEIKGKIQTIDVSSHRMVVEDSSNQKVTVTVTPDSVVTDSGNHAFNWTSLKAGDPVVVYYEPKEHVALQIDRRPTAAESVLGIDHPETSAR